MTKNIAPVICILTILLMVPFVQASDQGQQTTATQKDADPTNYSNPSNRPCCDSEVQGEDTKASLSSPKQAATEPGVGSDPSELQGEKTAQMTITKEAPSKPVQSANAEQTANNSNASSNQAAFRNKRIMELIRQLNELRSAAVAEAKNPKSPITQNTVKENTNGSEGWKTPAANSSAAKDLGQGQSTRNPAMNFDPRTKNRTDNMVRPEPRSLRKGKWGQSSSAAGVQKRRSPFQPPDHVIEKIKAKQAQSPLTNNLSNRDVGPAQKKCGECPPPPKNKTSINTASQMKATGKASVQSRTPVSPREKFEQAAAKVKKQMKAAQQAKENKNAPALTSNNNAPRTTRSGAGNVAKPQNRGASQQSAGPDSKQAKNQWQTPASAAKRQISGRVVGRGQ